MKNIIIVLLLVIIVGVGGYYYLKIMPDSAVVVNDQPVATTTPERSKLDVNEMVIGTSVEGRNISAFKYGTGVKKLLFVGGIHGGYEWNTVLVAYQLMDYLKANPTVIPTGVEVTVIPVLNPDGLNKVVGTSGRFTAVDVPMSHDVVVSGRFNAHNVDLNRNFDCDWQPSGMWQNTAVDGGGAVFSEPESQAMKRFVETYAPTAVVGWYSAAGGVYSSNCHDGVLPQTKAITSAYAKASGYPAHEVFDNYAITGDMENWLAKNKIPAISVLLTNHQDVEWDKNQKGVDALLKYYAK
ncbi:MAG: M14 family metallopeptidase [bacterium]|nr:M14 family metallopeptidase [bacterium]